MMEIEPPPTTIQRWKWNMRPYRRALGLGGRRRAGVLMYHRVADEISDPWGLCVTPDHFAQHMELLARHNAQIDLADLHGRKGYAPFGRRIAVTFDDGYLDNFIQAVPILERYGIPATIFVVAGALGRSEFWWDALDRAILGEGALPGELTIEIGGEMHSFDLAGLASEPPGDTRWNAGYNPPETQRQAFFIALWQAISAVAPAEQERAVTHILEWAGKPVAPPPNRGTASIDDVAKLKDHPLVTIGSHTMNHVSLPDLSPEEQKEEVESGHRALEEMIGAKIDRFSYPFGRYTQPARDCAEALGATLACTSHDGAVTPKSDLMAIPRLQVEDMDGDAFGEWLFRQYGLMEPRGWNP